tara:strand:- start:186 stop:437 length:252 start_codon:yes stop_codon:yes gene_type:complete
MNKIIITIGLLSGLSCQQKENTIELPEKAYWNHLVDNIQDMREWMQEDMKQGIIDSAYANYYIEYLNEAEDLTINLYKLNTNK